MSVTVGQRIYESSYGPQSAVQVDQGGGLNDALGGNVAVSGVQNWANADGSMIMGTYCRTGNIARPFTCATNGQVLTIVGLDVTSEFYVATGENPNIRIGYILQGKKLSVGRLITSVALVGSDTEITIDSSIDSVTTSGYCVDPGIGAGAIATGIYSTANGPFSRASGSYANATHHGAIAEGIQVTANKRMARSRGYGVAGANFNEDAIGSPWFQAVGDNSKRRLYFSGLCDSGSTLELTLDNTATSPSGAGAETMELPDNSVCHATLKISAYQANSLLANHGDAWAAEYKFGMKKKAGVITILGAGTYNVIFDDKDGAAGWSLDFDISGVQPVVNFQAQNGVIARVVVELEQVTWVN